MHLKQHRQMFRSSSIRCRCLISIHGGFINQETAAWYRFLIILLFPVSFGSLRFHCSQAKGFQLELAPLKWRLGNVISTKSTLKFFVGVAANDLLLSKKLISPMLRYVIMSRRL